MNLEDLKKAGKAPEWYDERSFRTICGGYMEKGETPYDMYMRVAQAAAKRAKRVDLQLPFFEIMWHGYLGPATPVLTNMGSDRGLPISCYMTEMQDSVDSIFNTAHEVAAMSKASGGVGISLDNIRPRKSKIATGGMSNGIVPWAKVLDTTISTVSQGSRRGAGSVNLNIDHPDWDEFIDIRDPSGDPNLRVSNLHHCTVVSNSFMERLYAGEKEAVRKWNKLITTRWDTGESYILFEDHVNDNNPTEYHQLGLKVKLTNICSEILQHTDEKHSVVCCLSSLNLSKWDRFIHQRWNGMGVIELSIRFLDAVMSEFIAKAKELPGMGKAVAGAIKARSLGLGVMGWHTLLQSKGLPFSSNLQSMMLNSEISKTIKEQANEASKKLAEEYGEPEWLKGSGRRNMHLMAYAPTRSNASICNTSPSIEPWNSNYYLDESSKGDFPVKNRILEEVLETYGKNDHLTWKSILKNEGSVQQLTFLSDEHKNIFKTARELNQMDLIRQAASRQKFIDQGQSLNLFFPINADPQYVMNTHLLAWELGVKTLYYVRTGAMIKGDILEECEGCHG